MRLKHVQQYKDRDGRTRRYVRIKGRPLVPLHSKPGTKAFVAEYEKALAGVPNAEKLAAASRLDEPGTLYFLDDGDFIKIGFTTNLMARLRMYRTYTATTKLLGHVPGSCRTDLETRKQFAHLQERGDWFRKDAELMTFITKAKRRLTNSTGASV